MLVYLFTATRGLTVLHVLETRMIISPAGSLCGYTMMLSPTPTFPRLVFTYVWIQCSSDQCCPPPPPPGPAPRAAIHMDTM